VRTDDYLGHLTDELEEFGALSFIEEFLKGINLNYENSKVVKFTTLRDMILKDTAPVHVHNPKR